jgi:hypothetical protein
VKVGDIVDYIPKTSSGTITWTSEPSQPEGQCGVGSYAGGPVTGAIAPCQAGFTYTGYYRDANGVQSGPIVVEVLA